MEEFDSKKAVIKLIDGTTITGRLNLKSNKRLSDLFNLDDNPFVVLFDVSFREELGKVIFINKSQIMWISPGA